MNKLLALTFFATALTGAGCSTQPSTASAESGGEIYTGSRIPRKGPEGSGVQSIDGGTYKQDMDRGMPQINPKGG